MQVAFLWLADVRGWEVSHLSDHGQDRGEWVVWAGVEGDVEDFGVVDYGVDGTEVVGCCLHVLAVSRG